jgi:hypothetical protein
MNSRSGRRPENPEIFRRLAFSHQKTKFFDERTAFGKKPEAV